MDVKFVYIFTFPEKEHRDRVVKSGLPPKASKQQWDNISRVIDMVDLAHPQDGPFPGVEPIPVSWSDGGDKSLVVYQGENTSVGAGESASGSHDRASSSIDGWREMPDFSCLASDSDDEKNQPLFVCPRPLSSR